MAHWQVSNSSLDGIDRSNRVRVFSVHESNIRSSKVRLHISQAGTLLLQIIKTITTLRRRITIADDFGEREHVDSPRV